MNRLLLIAGILLLFATEILRVYFIMPFPGSQHSETIDLAYFIDHNRVLLRLIGILLISYPAYAYFMKRKSWSKVLLSLVGVLYIIVFYFFNYKFEADKMFYQPGTIQFAGASANQVRPEGLVVGVEINHEAKAYPIQIIGYHHQVRDTIGGTPVMVTYCTVCRTGRVFSPLVNGKAENFRLVGMDHFNAMFEDATTKSWWRQATGTAIAGPLKNRKLAEINSSQSTLSEWLRLHPDSKVLQPDTVFRKNYEDLAGYDDGTIKGGLEKRDSGSWKAKSWVVGVRSSEGRTKAYDWNELQQRRLIQDTIGLLPMMIRIGEDSITFQVWSRVVEGQELRFATAPGGLRDENTGSGWDVGGVCVSGPLKGRQLQAVQSYQEFWHSWSYFHPLTTVYKD